MTGTPLTQRLAQYACETRWDDLPDQVRTEAVRAFLNWMGCVLGGCREPAVMAAVAAAAMTGGGSAATLIGHGSRSDLATAAFVNGLSSSILAFDDTHLATITHPTGPVAAAILAYAETRKVAGADFLNALSLGMEIECRLSNALLLPPARGNTALYVTGLSGPIGAAAALGRLMGLDQTRMRWAIGLAASMAAGFRATHGAMSGLMVPAQAARNAVFAATLAAQDFTCMEDVLESERGFLRLFAPEADPARAVSDLGVAYEVLANCYKPYPCGIVVHAALEACLDAIGQAGFDALPAAVRLTVPPVAISLADRRHPADFFEAQISLQHWAAYACLHRFGGIGGLRQEALEALEIRALREAVELFPNASFGRDEALAEVILRDGQVLRAHVLHARGSAPHPMTDSALDAKFLAQGDGVLTRPDLERLLGGLRGMADCDDVARSLGILVRDSAFGATADWRCPPAAE